MPTRRGIWARRIPWCMILRQVLSHCTLLGTHCYFGWLLRLYHPSLYATLLQTVTTSWHATLPLLTAVTSLLLLTAVTLWLAHCHPVDACQPGRTSGLALQTKQWYDPSQGPPKATTIGPPPQSSLATVSAKGYTPYSFLANKTYAALPFHPLLFAFHSLSGKCQSVI